MLATGPFEKIEGIGRFKIGISTPATLVSLAKERGVIIEDGINNFLSLNLIRRLHGKVNGTIFEIEPVCPQTEIYYVRSYKASGLALEHLYLTFFKGLLIRVYCKSSFGIYDQLFSKYGPPKIEMKNVDIPCKSPSSVNILIKEKRFASQWTNGKIVAVNRGGIDYNPSNCDPIPFGNIDIGLIDKQKEAKECNEAFRAKKGVNKLDEL